MLSIYREIVSAFKNHGIQYRHDVDGAEFSALHVGGRVFLAVYPDTEDRLIATIRLAENFSIPYQIVGNGSDLFVSGNGFSGMLISTAGIRSCFVNGNYVTASCGCLFSQLQSMVSRLGRTLPPALLGIPGSVGGMVTMNAGAFGVDISDCLISANFYQPMCGRTITLPPEKIGFAYRNCSFASYGNVLLSATFSTTEADPNTQALVKKYMNERRRSQPLGYRSLGSFYRRVFDQSAGYYIERSGCKGFRIGGAAVSVKHAGFFLNLGHATADDFETLDRLVSSRVYRTFGVTLKREVKIISDCQTP